MLERFNVCDRDTWAWKLMTLHDLREVGAVSIPYFDEECVGVIKPNVEAMIARMGGEILQQVYNSTACQLSVARNKVYNKLMAYAWIDGSGSLCFSSDRMATGRVVWIDQTLPAKTRVTLMAQILQQWDQWAVLADCDVIYSGSIRLNAGAFNRLHEQAGYTIRGSTAFKRIKELK